MKLMKENLEQIKRDGVQFEWKSIIEKIPDKFESPEEMRKLQDELQNKFQKLDSQMQERVMRELGEELGKLHRQRAETDDELEQQSIYSEINKIRFLLQTLHLVFKIPEY